MVRPAMNAAVPSSNVTDLPQALRSGPLRTIAPAATLALLALSLWLGLGQHWAEAGLSLLLAAASATAAMLAWHRHMDLAGTVSSITNALGCLLAVTLHEQSALPWAFLALMANFFIVRYEIATPVNLALVIGLLLQPDLLLAPLQPQSLAVIVLIFGLGYRFSRRLQGDRNRLEQLASLDALTGVPNRRAMERALNLQVAGHRDNRFRHALLVLDIDHFKEVNDRYGHSAGDTALSDLASILRFQLRGEDKVFRFGGEEFVILVEIGNREALACFTERIRKAVYEALRGPGGRITISLGAAMYAGEAHWEDWFTRADAALYEAKHQGRNNVIIAG